MTAKVVKVYSFKDNRADPLHQHSVFEMPAHGLCEDATLYLPSDPDHIVHAIAVGNMGDT